MRTSYSKPSGWAWVLIASLAASSTPAMAGVVYEIDVKDHEQSPPKTETIETAVEGKNLSMDIASGGKGSQGKMIFRGDRREVVVVDHESKSYHVMDEAFMERIGGQLGQVEKQMQEALKNVPEDKRAMVEQMMKQRMPKETEARPQSELRKTGERETHAGYPCVKYEVFLSGKKTRELWVTDWDNIEGGSDTVEAFEEMADFFKKMMESLPVGANNAGDQAFEHMKELGGFPVVTREFNDDGSLEGEATLRSAKRQTIDPDAFEPPSGYKRQEMFQ